MSLLEKIKLFVSNEMLMFEFARGVKKIHTEENSCLGRGDCAIMDFINPIIICFQKNISLNAKKVFLSVSALETRAFLSFYQEINFSEIFFVSGKKI